MRHFAPTVATLFAGLILLASVVSTADAQVNGYNGYYGGANSSVTAGAGALGEATGPNGSMSGGALGQTQNPATGYGRTYNNRYNNYNNYNNGYNRGYGRQYTPGYGNRSPYGSTGYQQRGYQTGPYGRSLQNRGYRGVPHGAYRSHRR